MMVFERISALEAENKCLKRQISKLNSESSIKREWEEVKTWLASFGVRLLLVGGVIFYLIVLPLAFFGGV